MYVREVGQPCIPACTRVIKKRLVAGRDRQRGFSISLQAFDRLTESMVL